MPSKSFPHAFILKKARWADYQSITMGYGLARYIDWMGKCTFTYSLGSHFASEGVPTNRT